MIKPDNKKTTLLVAFLVSLLIVGFKMMFMKGEDLALSPDEITSHERIQNALNKLSQINFDTSIMKDPKFTSLKSIEVDPLNLPSGKNDPFSADSN